MNKEEKKKTVQKILILVKGCEYSEKLKNALDYSGIINMIDEVKIIDITSSENMEFIKLHNLSNFPAIIKLENDEVKEKIIGLKPLTLIREFLSY